MSQKIAIIAAKRTPQGRFLGRLAKLSAVDLALAASNAILSELNCPDLLNFIDISIIGNVLSAGQGMNIARQIAVKLGVPASSPAFSVNMMCGSGLKSIMLGCDAIRSGQAQLVLCGGTESMTLAPHLLPGIRTGLKFGEANLIDSILKDGLVDAFDGEHMGKSADRLAKEFGISRYEQDNFALQSQQRAIKSICEGVFQNEISPTGGLSSDEHPRSDCTLESLASLKPAFSPDGTVTAGNASGINDGSSILLLASTEMVKKFNLKAMAYICDYVEVGCDPRRMGLGPVFAIKRILDRNSPDLAHYDRIEINEAFAAQALACVNQLKLSPDRINVHGGAIALGHPIGASGARLVTHLSHQLASGNANNTIASLCVGGGMGVAMTLSRELND
ncbi:MAG: acetyl-CoA C-acyltransferase [bacterium]